MVWNEKKNMVSLPDGMLEPWAWQVAETAKFFLA
jgi:hypothetical protein